MTMIKIYLILFLSFVAALIGYARMAEQDQSKVMDNVWHYIVFWCAAVSIIISLVLV
jgi:uncharacterized membrane protein